MITALGSFAITTTTSLGAFIDTAAWWAIIITTTTMGITIITMVTITIITAIITTTEWLGIRLGQGQDCSPGK